MEEIWKDIEGFEGLYEVSSQGRVRSVERTETIRNRWGQVAERKYKERILRPHMSMGYLTVDLAHGGKISKKRIHRLMAEAFIPGGSADLEVNHINEDRTDNRLENLEWVTH